MTSIEPSPHHRPDPSPGDDPYAWLEEVEGEAALEWVRERNAETIAWAEAAPGWATLRAALLDALESDDRIPPVSGHGGRLYGHWQDRDHVRGLWRRTTLESYGAPQTDWEPLIDLDALAAAEGEPWVWAGATGLPPAYDRWLVALSRGGADATVVREWDLPSRSFVTDGFVLPEAKQDVSWIDRQTIWVGTDAGPGSCTVSGYPRTVRRWSRGTPLADAPVVIEGETDDVLVAVDRDHTPGFLRDIAVRVIDFYRSERWLLGADGTRTRIDVPDSAEVRFVRAHLLVELREPWTTGGRTWPAGALLAIGLEPFLRGERSFVPLYEPTPSSSLAAIVPTRTRIVLDILEDVRHRLEVWVAGPDGWRRTPFPGGESLASVVVRAVDPDESDDCFLTVTDWVTPSSLFLVRPGAEPVLIRRLSDSFDASGLELVQRFATSADGTRIPYFLVRPRDLVPDGRTPTLLYGYGGFEVALTPAYNPAVGRAWLAAGGAYAVANLRGGGEYGPIWHSSAVKAGRRHVHEDLAAVADDLVATGVTSPDRLGAMGRSNGGLLVGNAITLLPDRFGAAVCEVPLLDMRRYHRLLAGASWMAEYGDPDDPDEWAFIRTWSPYHNIPVGTPCPPTIILTSTRDDRVHPGHARKMAARMRELGHEVRYFEQLEGGHPGAADNRALATTRALAWWFLRERLTG